MLTRIAEEMHRGTTDVEKSSRTESARSKHAFCTFDLVHTLRAVRSRLLTSLGRRLGCGTCSAATASAGWATGLMPSSVPTWGRRSRHGGSR